MKKSIESIFRGKSVTLLGAGISNTPLARYLAPMCSRLTVRDIKTAEQLGEAAETFAALGCTLITGENYLTGITEDIVFRSPGIRPDIPELLDAASRGCVITSEVELFLSLHPCPVYAITGSDGKSTTTTIVSKLLMPEGKVFLGGNIGEPLLYRYDKIGENDALAVELSSFQLMTIDAPIDVAAVTNITPNHLNWHTSMDEYIDAKRRILAHCGRAVLNYDNEITRKIAQDVRKTSTPITYFSLSPIPEGVLRELDSAVYLDGGRIMTRFPGEGVAEVMTRADIKLPGLHNTANYMTAIAVTHGTTTNEKIRDVAHTFGGVEHRLEFVRTLNGVTYINSSIDSSPTRTAAALSALSDRPVVLIAGGYDKHIPYEPLADAILDSTVKTLVLTGDTADKIFAAVTSHKKYETAVQRGFNIIRSECFDSAITSARYAAVDGDTVLLSPASASFDCFKNFEERGRHYKDMVNSFE